LQNSYYCKKSLNTDPFTIHLTLKRAVNGKIRFIAKTILPKMYKSVGYLQNYSRTDKKRRRKKIQYTFELID
jgi:hypothetical protein